MIFKPYFAGLFGVYIRKPHRPLNASSCSSIVIFSLDYCGTIVILSMACLPEQSKQVEVSLDARLSTALFWQITVNSSALTPMPRLFWQHLLVSCRLKL